MHPFTAMHLATMHEAEARARADAHRLAARLRQSRRAPSPAPRDGLLVRALAAGRRMAPGAARRACPTC